MGPECWSNVGDSDGTWQRLDYIGSRGASAPSIIITKHAKKSMQKSINSKHHIIVICSSALTVDCALNFGTLDFGGLRRAAAGCRRRGLLFTVPLIAGPSHRFLRS